MCNLYSVTKGQAAIIALTRAMRDTTGNLPPMPGVFPDYFAPVVRNAKDGVRELATARWGMPSPPAYGGAPVTNIRNVKSPHWRAWLTPAHRCVVPFSSFCEYADTKPRKTPTWFAFDQTRPLAVFAGIWTIWKGVRGPKSKPVEGEHELFGFLTTEPNDMVAPIWSLSPAEMAASSSNVLERQDRAMPSLAVGARSRSLRASRPLCDRTACQLGLADCRSSDRAR
jgi:putative SOS response-associated peptidase YedK